MEEDNAHQKTRLRLSWLVLGLCLILTLPWMERKPFHTKGEPREAITAQSMLETGNWILPERYGDDEATKPPLSHWMMSLFSLVQGKTTEGTSRLHSILSYMALSLLWFRFLSGRFSNTIALSATFVLMSSFLFVQHADSARVDMLLTVLMVAGMLRMFRWYEKQWKGIPWEIPLLLGLAALTKGPVGIVLPCFVFGTFLLVERVPLLTIIRQMSILALPALILPAFWYFAAYMQGGMEFIQIVIDENIARFTGNMTIGGTHEHSVFYMLASVLWGWLPWTLLALLAIVPAGWNWLARLWVQRKAPPIKKSFSGKALWGKVREWAFQLTSFERFSIIAVLCILTFYAIPESKRDVYLMPAYPFIALGLARLFLRETPLMRKAWNIYAWFLAAMGILLLLAILLVATKLVTPGLIISMGIDNESLSHFVGIFNHMYEVLPWVDVPVLLVFCAAWVYLLRSFRNKQTQRIRSALFLGSFVLLLMATLQPTVGRAVSARPFAEEVMEYDIPPDKLFYFRTGFYGLSFYLNNRFEKLEQYMPASAFVLVAEKELTDFESWAQNKYLCHIETASPHRHNDMRQRVFLVHVEKLSP